MKSKTYLWLEDRKGKSSYIFWKTFMGQLCPEIVVESKKNNSELVKCPTAHCGRSKPQINFCDNSSPIAQSGR